MRRLIYGLISLLLLGTEVLIGLFGQGWVRIYLGDVLVVILLYTIVRTMIPNKKTPWFIIPAAILIFVSTKLHTVPMTSKTVSYNPIVKLRNVTISQLTPGR